MHVKFEVDKTHIPVFESKKIRYVILMGGRGNARSGTASRYAVSRLLGKDYTRGAIMRGTHADIRPSCWREIKDRITEQGIENNFHIVENDMFIERGQNSLRAHGFKSSSGSLTARLKSLAGYNFVWIEEGEETLESEFRTLDDTLRTVKGDIQIVITLNTPPKNHWIIKKWFNLEPHPEAKGFYIPTLKPEFKDEVLFITGTYRENEPNLSFQTIQQYQRYKTEKPAYYWQMIEGLSPETVMGRIYSGWKEIDEIPHEARLIGYWLDFGYDPDPAAIGAVYFYNGGYILDEKLYATHLRNEHLALTLKGLPRAPIVADNAEPKSIAELQIEGLNVLPCEKGKDSVDFGIKHVQGLRISYTKRSKNIKDEYENYAWKRRKDGVEDDDHLGVEDPNCANHHMSGIRYFATMFCKQTYDEDYWDNQLKEEYPDMKKEVNIAR